MLVSHTFSTAVLAAVTHKLEPNVFLQCTMFFQISMAVWPSVHNLNCVHKIFKCGILLTFVSTQAS